MFFFQEFSQVCQLSLASTRLLMVVQKITSHRNALRALKISYSDVGEGGVAVYCEKNTIFPEQPVVSSLLIHISL